jgi:hypothetical protein
MDLNYYGQNPLQTPLVMNSLIPGIFPTIADRDNYLSSFDQETRDYILQNTDDFRSISDIAKCVERYRQTR